MVVASSLLGFIIYNTQTTRTYSQTTEVFPRMCQTRTTSCSCISYLICVCFFGEDLESFRFSTTCGNRSELLLDLLKGNEKPGLWSNLTATGA